VYRQLLSNIIGIYVMAWTQEGAFDESVRGVDAIVHMASPCHADAVEIHGKHFQYFFAFLVR
jgi:hypothetical protein